jgi:hypothetical protein
MNANATATQIAIVEITMRLRSSPKCSMMDIRACSVVVTELVLLVGTMFAGRPATAWRRSRPPA